jgi:hypothetical protein
LDCTLQCAKTDNFYKEAKTTKYLNEQIKKEVPREMSKIPLKKSSLSATNRVDPESAH